MQRDGGSRRQHAAVSTLLTVFMATLSWPSSARAEVVRLRDLERQAVQSRDELAVDAARVRGASAESRKAASTRYPRFALKADSTLAPGRKFVKITRGAEGGEEYTVQATPTLDDGSSAFVPQLRNGIELSGQATLYDFGRTKTAIEAGRVSESATAAASDVTRHAIISAVRGSYLGWLSAHQLAAFAEQAAREAAQRRERVAALIEEGVRSQGELVPARADELLTKLELERSQGELASARLALEQAVGGTLSPNAEPDLSLLQVDASPAPSANDPTLRALTLQHSAALSMARVHRAATAPDLSLGVSAGMRNQQGDFFPLYGAGLTLTVPLWDGGFSAANAESARARAAELSAQIHARERDRDYSQRQADLDAENARARLSTAQELLEVCITRLRDAESGYELGATGIDQIAQARALVRRAQTELLFAKVAHSEARLRVTPTEP